MSLKMVSGSLFLVAVLAGSLAFGRLLFSRSAVAEEHLSTMSAEQRAAAYQAGPEWDGKGQGDVDEAALVSYKDQPVYWLGPKALGYNLQAILRMKYDPPSDRPYGRPQDSLLFIYGRCTPAPDAGRCGAPIAVYVQPVCLVTPGMIAERVKVTPTPEVFKGSALQQRFKDGHVQIWTGDVSVIVHPTADHSRVNELVALLREFGASSPMGAGSDLPPPNFATCKSG